MSGILLHSVQGQATHFACEVAAYFVGGRLYWGGARRGPQPEQPADRLLIVAGVVFFAFLGSKALHLLQHLPYLLAQGTPGQWLGGKSVLGGLLGGFLGAELAKRAVGWKPSTGDAWVPALAAGLVIGRLGCQLSGLWDQTYGGPTSLPWGWDYGDGVPRHPVALYEMALVTLLFTMIRTRWQAAAGARFAVFLGGYCLIRFGLEYLKPPHVAMAAIDALPSSLYLGWTAIQWAAVAGAAWGALVFRHRLQRGAAAA